ncbi:hypothetical protein Tco_0798480 [Tanacetum coccineum]
MTIVLDCFLLDGPLASLPEAAHLQSCLEQLTIPIYHADVNAVAGETSLSFAIFNVHTRAEDAKKYAAALYVQYLLPNHFIPLSKSAHLTHLTHTSQIPIMLMDLDTDEDLGSVVCMPQLKDPRFDNLHVVTASWSC